MTQKIVYIVLFVMLMPFSGNSQQASFGLQGGIGTFHMKGLKSINETIVSGLSFDSRIVSDFPPFFYYRPAVKVKINDLTLGLVYTFQSTGSRVSAKDYSAEYRYDMIIKSGSPGIYGDILLIPDNKVRVGLYSVFGCLFTGLKMSEYFILLESKLIDDAYRFKSFNFFIEPGFNLNYPVKYLDFGLNGGYLLQFGSGSFHFAGNKYAKLINQETGEPVKPGWNGFRAGLSVSYTFHKNLNK